MIESGITSARDEFEALHDFGFDDIIAGISEEMTNEIDREIMRDLESLGL